MAPHQQMESCTVTTAHLEPVEGRERLMHREPDADRRRIRPETHQLDDTVGGAESIPTHGPGRILEFDERGVDRLQFRSERGPDAGSERSSDHRSVGVEQRLEGGDLPVDTRDQGRDTRRRTRHLDEQTHTCHAAQQRISLSDERSGLRHCSSGRGGA